MAVYGLLQSAMQQQTSVPPRYRVFSVAPGRRCGNDCGLCALTVWEVTKRRSAYKGPAIPRCFPLSQANAGIGRQRDQCAASIPSVSASTHAGFVNSKYGKAAEGQLTDTMILPTGRHPNPNLPTVHPCRPLHRHCYRPHPRHTQLVPHLLHHPRPRCNRPNESPPKPGLSAKTELTQSSRARFPNPPYVGPAIFPV